MANEIFNVDKILDRVEELKKLPPFKPDLYEPRFSVTQRFSTGNDAACHKDVTLLFVLRNGEMVFYDSKEQFVK